MNKVVARLADGRLVKGVTLDFAPDKSQFHVGAVTLSDDELPVTVRTAHLKALFFVKDLDGDPHHVERNEFLPGTAPDGRRVAAQFMDGEVLVGTTKDYAPEAAGFFLVPADPESNIQRCFVPASATREVRVVAH